MKVGIYLIDAVVTGTTKFMFELADGLRAEDHEVRTITSTKSGREPVRWTKSDGGARWWFQSPDVTCSHDDLVGTLDLFDLVIVQDVGSSTLDGEDFNHSGTPGYVHALLQVSTPWVMIAHGNSYDAKHAPHFPRLLAESRRPPKAIIATTAPYEYGSHELFSGLAEVPTPRPYALKLPAVIGPLEYPPRATSIGRFSTGKNLHALALTLPFVDSNATGSIALAGATISSARPTDAYLTYETLITHSDVVEVPDGAPESKNRTSPWQLRSRTGTRLDYSGAYTNPLPLLETSKLFVNNTAASFSAGTEYTTMEAVDAGCLLLMPERMVDAGSSLAYGKLVDWEIPRNPKNALARNEADLRALAVRVDHAMATDWKTHEDLALHNRDVVWSRHRPSSVASDLIRNLRGVL